MNVGFFQCDVARCAEKNIARISSALRKPSPELLVLPELSMCGYLFVARAELVPAGAATQRMILLSKEYACTLIFGLAELENGRIYNTAVIVSKGRYIGKYRKIHLTDYEKSVFDRGTENAVSEVDGTKIGVQICFDLWFPEISREQIRMGADILCALANFGGETTRQISKIRAIENLTPLALCNRIGKESIPGMDADFLGKSTIFDSSGKAICEAAEREESFVCGDICVCGAKANIICNDFNKEISFHYHVS